MGPREDSKSSPRLRTILSYGVDWFITIGFAVSFFMLDYIHGYQRVFSLQDKSLQHPYKTKEIIPTYALVIISFVGPALFQPVINLATARSWWDLHTSTLGLTLSLSVTNALTQFIKISVGRPRPDFITRCNPRNGTIDPTFGLSTAAVCTQIDYAILRDGFKSFPSGHSSMSFAGMGFLAFYFAGKYRLFDKKGHTLKVWIFAAPLACAAFVAISRTMDYRHHWGDVLAGSLLGLCVSYFCYRQYYPSHASADCQKPFPMRCKANEPVLPVQLPLELPECTMTGVQQQGGISGIKSPNAEDKVSDVSSDSYTFRGKFYLHP